MFSAHARLRLAPVQLDFDIGLESRFRIGSTRRVGALWDTRCTAPNPGTEERVVVYFVVEGELRWHDPIALALSAPGVFVATSAQLGGAKGRRVGTFRSTGTPFVACEVHVAPRDVVGPTDAPRRIEVGRETIDAVRAYTTLAHAERALGPTERDPLVASVLRALHRDGVLRHDLAPTMRTVEGGEALLWRAIVPFIEELILGPSLDAMSSRTQLSLRQLGRGVDRFLRGFSLPFTGWRALNRGYRLHIAVLLLSNPELTVAAIAERTGYSSPEALAHALTAEGLPPPVELRRRILEAT